MLDERRIRIRTSDYWIRIRIQEAQNHTDPTDTVLSILLCAGDDAPLVGDVVLSQNSGVPHQLSLAGGTTLDLSDIKWGILEPAAVIKRSASMEQQQQQQLNQQQQQLQHALRLNMQEEEL